MHSQGVNVPSEMIKEMAIRILDGVNEMCPDEKKIYGTLSNGPFIDVTRTAQEAGRRLLPDKRRIVFDNIMHFHLR